MATATAVFIFFFIFFFFFFFKTVIILVPRLISLVDPLVPFHSFTPHDGWARPCFTPGVCPQQPLAHLRVNYLLMLLPSPHHPVPILSKSSSPPFKSVIHSMWQHKKTFNNLAGLRGVQTKVQIPKTYQLLFRIHHYILQCISPPYS